MSLYGLYDRELDSIVIWMLMLWKGLLSWRYCQLSKFPTSPPPVRRLCLSQYAAYSWRAYIEESNFFTTDFKGKERSIAEWGLTIRSTQWALVIAGIGDFYRPAEKLSLTQNIALTCTGLIWTRWCLIIKPKNILYVPQNLIPSILTLCIPQHQLPPPNKNPEALLFFSGEEVLLIDISILLGSQQ